MQKHAGIKTYAIRKQPAATQMTFCVRLFLIDSLIIRYTFYSILTTSLS